MILSEKGLTNRKAWEDQDYQLPNFDRVAVRAATKENPVWIHFGAGSIFRAVLAHGVQKLLNNGNMNKGLIVVGRREVKDQLSILATIRNDGTLQKTVLGSVVESCVLDYRNQQQFDKLKTLFEKPSLQMVSFTITEKGYRTEERDFENGPCKSTSYFGMIAGLLYARYKAGGPPLAMLSLDNCAQNGEHLRKLMLAYVSKWEEKGLVEEGFLSYVRNKKRVSFPCSMLDKITPTPSKAVEACLRADGVESEGECCGQLPFVNAEETEYVVIEDDFPNGRPPLEDAGFYMTDRQNVEKAERMKVSACLNPLHTAIAIFGCLLGYTQVSEVMRDADVKKLVYELGYKEGLPIVDCPGMIPSRRFLDQVLLVRLPNPCLQDSPQRIAEDTSQKLSIRFGQTIKTYAERESLQVEKLKAIPLVVAGWLRYLLGVNDEGQMFIVSADPRLEEMRGKLEGIGLKVGGKQYGEVSETVLRKQLEIILRDDTLFGVDLCQAGLGETVMTLFLKMLDGVGAVRTTLRLQLQEELGEDCANGECRI